MFITYIYYDCSYRFQQENNWNAATQCNEGSQCNDWLNMMYAFSTNVGCARNTQCSNSGQSTYVCVYSSVLTSDTSAPYQAKLANTTTCQCEQCDTSYGNTVSNICVNALNTTTQQGITQNNKNTQWSTLLADTAQSYAEQCPTDTSVLPASGIKNIKYATTSDDTTLISDISQQINNAAYIGCGIKTCTAKQPKTYVCLYGSKNNTIDGAVVYNHAISKKTTTNNISTSSHSSSGISGGAIAGIVIGILATVVLALIAGWCIRRQRKRNNRFVMSEGGYGLDSNTWGDSGY